MSIMESMMMKKIISVISCMKNVPDTYGTIGFRFEVILSIFCQ